VPRPPLDREAEFRRLFAEHHRHVLAYALRRTEQRADAEDVVAGTRVLANQRRSQALAVARDIIRQGGQAGRATVRL
jgi:DNA-directed RNA polymerase specialized sigma24 family protein